MEGASRIGVRDMLSYQSLMPAGAGTPRYEKPELWLGTANLHGRFCHAPPRPQRGTSPRATFSHSAFDHRPVERQGIGQHSGECVWVRWASSASALELPGHFPECELPTATGDEGVAHALPLCRSDAFR